MAGHDGFGRVRVLLADDTAEIRTLIRIGLELDGRFEVIAEAADGHEAVALAEEHQPDVAMVDLAMPLMDGLEAIPLIRERSPGSKIVVLSALSEKHMGSEVAALGADGYLEKGTSPEDIIATLAALFGVPRVRQPDATSPPASTYTSDDATGSKRESASASDIDRLVDHLAHELRAPLRVMQGFAVTLGDALGRGDTETAKIGLDAVMRNLRVLDGLVASLLDARAVDVGRLELELEVVDVGALAAETARDVGSILHRPVSVEVDQGSLARGDPVRLRQVVVNLVTNADKFTVDASPIDVTVVRVQDGPIELSVRDRGPGIPAHERPRLFKRFGRLARDDFVPGSGLGLYLSRAIARAHGGDIVFTDPTDGEGGSCFVLRLPPLPTPS